MRCIAPTFQSSYETLIFFTKNTQMQCYPHMHDTQFHRFFKLHDFMIHTLAGYDSLSLIQESSERYFQ